jgi:hypothetical protein
MVPNSHNQKHNNGLQTVSSDSIRLPSGPKSCSVTYLHIQSDRTCNVGQIVSFEQIQQFLVDLTDKV